MSNAYPARSHDRPTSHPGKLIRKRNDFRSPVAASIDVASNHLTSYGCGPLLVGPELCQRCAVYARTPAAQTTKGVSPHRSAGCDHATQSGVPRSMPQHGSTADRLVILILIIDIDY